MGQYFTPRWLTDLMAEMADVTVDKSVLDPCCGTGGFLIAATAAAARREGKEWDEVAAVMAGNKQLMGFDLNASVAAISVVNMVR